MKSLPHGLYEQLINTHLEEKLRGQGIPLSKDNLKNFDSSVLLSQYLSPVLKKSLEFLENSQGSTVLNRSPAATRLSVFSQQSPKRNVSTICRSLPKEKSSSQSATKIYPQSDLFGQSHPYLRAVFLPDPHLNQA